MVSSVHRLAGTGTAGIEMCYDTGRYGGTKQAWQGLDHMKEKKRVLSLELKVGHE